jgi:ribonuclease P protein component
MLIKANFLNAKVVKSEEAKVFFSVSKKVAKLAVQRNKLKRMGRLALLKYADNIKDVSIQFYFTSVPKNQLEVDNDVTGIIKNIK